MAKKRQKKGGRERGCKKCGGGGGRLARGDSTRLSPAISLGKVMEEGRGRRRKRRGSGKSSMVGLPVYCADKIQTRQNIIPTVEKHAGILSRFFF